MSANQLVILQHIVYRKGRTFYDYRASFAHATDGLFMGGIPSVCISCIEVNKAKLLNYENVCLSLVYNV